MDKLASELGSLYLADEDARLRALIALADLDDAARKAVHDQAVGLAAAARAGSRRGKLIDQFLQEYGLSTPEGVTLMRLCEALIRTPDAMTKDILVRDKIGEGEWAEHVAHSSSLLVNLSTRGLQISRAWISSTGGTDAENLAAKLGDAVLRQAMQQAMGLMGEHFVLGTSISNAMEKAKPGEAEGYAYSYDMLGEAAHTTADAARYFQAYKHALETLVVQADAYGSMAEAPGISVKLSALHPRYEYAQRADCVPALVERLTSLCVIAKQAGYGLTIDAEEADRLETSLEIVAQLLTAPELEGWDGLGVVVQAYQRPAPAVIKGLADMARAASRKITVRLVKGAYWDMEIKRAQEMGLESYPVFTRKENTDVSYLGCARLLFAASDCIFPQFATHNAHTAAAVMQMAGTSKQYEFQRLHGMGETLHEALMQASGVHCRVYAPVGQHKDLLPYLVRRLLENGANSSFVNQLLDPSVEIEEIVGDPLALAASHDKAQHPSIPDPRDQFGGVRLAAKGTDLTQSTAAAHVEVLSTQERSYRAGSLISGVTVEGAEVPVTSPATGAQVGIALYAEGSDVDRAVQVAGRSSWGQVEAGARAACLAKMADLLEEHQDLFLHLCMSEAGKTYADGVAEVREAVDFCRYYAEQATSPAMAERAPLGVVACISPWNFPLAIFLGQVAASLAAGNPVVAKPAEQTPLIAFEAVRLFHQAGVPQDALQLIIGEGAKLGSALVSHESVAGVCFTGSTRTAKAIARNLADTGRPLTPLIAETGGLNAMIIDSTALLEQAVGDVVDSAFQSAGQRCSACRVVCIQDDIADDFIAMLSGSMALLKVGDPGTLESDVGPVIDGAALEMLEDYIQEKRKVWPVLHETEVPTALAGTFVRPIAFEIKSISDLEHEVFGPVLHVVRFQAEELDALLAQINALGYGLTMGVHTRIDARVEEIAAKARIGNIYVNRNQIGAVVGVQPFGGEGLSGTGPKAGGPHYLLRLSKAAEEIAADGDALPLEGAVGPIGHSSIGQVKEACRTVLELDRAALFEKLEDPIAQEMLSLIREVFAREILLPGPTGERNSLRLAPRGALLCLGTDLELVKRQMLLALASGNGVIVGASAKMQGDVEALVSELRKAGLPAGLVKVVSEEEALACLHGDIDGVICDGPSRAAVATLLCRRDGAILPVLSAFDDPARYCVERTLTINTTAAGGNASLLAM